MANKNQENRVVYRSPETALSHRGGPKGSGTRPDFKCSLAVVVGIDDYGHGIPPLRSAANDARRLAHILRADYEYEVDLLAEDVTLDRVRGLLTEQLPARINQDDRVLFYFAGHGIALDGDDGPAGYLVPQDARPEDRDSFLPMHELHEALAALPCRHLLAVLDCCFAGAFRWSSTRDLLPVPEVIHQERYDRFIRDPAWQVITSAASDQRALDILAGDPLGDRGDASAAEHSPFALALFEALRGAGDVVPKGQGDGVITATELYLYLRDYVEIKAEDQARHRQTPGIWPLRKHDKGEYIFLVPGHELNLPPAPELTAENNPYRGLEPYEERHKELFFGRDELIEKLAKTVESQPLTVVLGTSGTGKSSLVRAGLLPHLRGQVSGGRESGSALPEAQASPLVGGNEGGTEGGWHILPPLRPGPSPLRSLNSLLTTHLPTLGSKVSPSRLSTGSDALANLATSWSLANPGRNLLLVVDQLEELITLCQVEPEREQFLRLLAAAIEAQPDQFRLVLTLRSDFEPQIRSLLEETVNVKATTISLSDQPAEEPPSQPQTVPDLKPEAATPGVSPPPSPASHLRSLTWTRFIVPPMSQAELREAIEEPASVRVLYFEPADLVDRLIDEVIQTPGALPLLSFTLSEMYIRYLARQEESRATGEAIDRSLTAGDYETLGGVVGSLRNRATHEYDRLAVDFENGAAYQATMRRIVLRMVAIEGGELARRRVPRAELVYADEIENERVETVLRRLLDTRLIVGGESEGEPYVEPAHDALVRAWDKLLIWRTEAEDYLPLQRRLTQAANDWEAAADDKAKQDLLWDDDPRLPQLVRVLDEDALAEPDRGWYYQRLQSWVFRGRRSEETTFPNWLNRRETGFVQQSVVKRLKNTRRVINIFAEVLLIVLGFTLIALILQQQAVDARDLAEDRRVEAQDARALADERRDAAVNAEATAIAERDAARAATSRQLANQSDRRLSSSQYEIAILLAIEAGRTFDTFEAFAGIRKAIAHPWHSRIILYGPHRGTLNRDESKILTIGQRASSLNYPSFLLGAPWKDDIGNIVRIWDTRSGRELVRLKGHTDTVNQAIWSQDESKILTSSDDGTARIWDATSGEELVRLKGHTDRVLQAEWNQDESKVLTRSGSPGNYSYNAVRIWNATNGDELVRFEGHTGYVREASWSQDESRVLTRGTDGTVRIWDAKAGNEILRLNAHSADIHRAEWNQDESKILTVGGSTARIWDASSGEDLARLESYDGGGVWSQDESKIVAGGLDNVVAIYDTRRGEELARLEGHADNVLWADWHRDESRIVTGGLDNQIRIWDTTRGHELVYLEWAEYAMLSHDETKLFTFDYDAFSDCTGYVISVNTGAQLTALEGHIDTNAKVIWSQDGSKLLAASRDVAWSRDGSRLLAASRDHTVRIWDVYSGEELLSLDGHTSDIEQAKWSQDESKILTNSRDGTVRIWDANSGDELVRIQAHVEREWNEDGYEINVQDGTVLIRDANSGEWVRIQVLQQAKWNQDESKILTSSPDGTARIWDANSGDELVRIQGHAEAVLEAKWSQDESKILTNSRDGTARIWDANSGDELVRMIGHARSVEQAMWSQDESKVLTLASDSTARIWNATNGRELVRLEGHGKSVLQAMWNRDESEVLTTGCDQWEQAENTCVEGTARIWDAASGAELTRLEGHTGAVVQATWSQDESKILTAGETTARIWDAASGAELVRLEGHARSVSKAMWLQGESKILTVGEDSVRIWFANMVDLIQAACSYVPRNMTWAEWNRFIGGPYRPTCVRAKIPPDVIQAIQAEAAEKASEGDATAANEQLTELNQWLVPTGQLDYYGRTIEELIENRLANEKKLSEDQQRMRNPRGRALEKAVEILAADIDNGNTSFIDVTMEQIELLLDPPPSVGGAGETWNTLCWCGSLIGYADLLVDTACEHAVNQADLIRYTAHRDSRGLARALAGDTEGAIEDFSYFADNYSDSELAQQRRKWIQRLENGENPLEIFNDELLETLLQEQ